MKIGIGTYTYMWSIGFPGARPFTPMDALGLVARGQQLGAGVVQFGPNLALENLTEGELAKVINLACDSDIELEIGTRGIEFEHLCKQLALAEQLRCTLVRTVPELAGGAIPSLAELIKCLRTVVPELRRRRIRLAVENGRIPAQDLADVMNAVADPWIGITLDTVNSLSIPEGTKHVVKTLAKHTMSFHVKDFRVQRSWHSMGFDVEGTPAGKGQMDLPWILKELKSVGSNANAILELWPPQQSDIESTVRLEQAWAEESIQYMRRHIPHGSHTS